MDAQTARRIAEEIYWQTRNELGQHWPDADAEKLASEVQDLILTKLGY